MSYNLKPPYGGFSRERVNQIKYLTSGKQEIIGVTMSNMKHYISVLLLLLLLSQ